MLELVLVLASSTAAWHACVARSSSGAFSLLSELLGGSGRLKSTWRKSLKLDEFRVTVLPCLVAVIMLPFTAVTVYGSLSQAEVSFLCFFSLNSTWLPTYTIGTLAFIRRLYSSWAFALARASLLIACLRHYSLCSGVSGSMLGIPEHRLKPNSR